MSYIVLEKVGEELVKTILNISEITVKKQLEKGLILDYKEHDPTKHYTISGNCLYEHERN